MSRKQKREALTFELTPLIDVVFLLLIFFMVSSVFKKDELALLLNLPKSEQGEGKGKEKKKIVIEINKDEIAYQGKKVSIEDLDSTLATLSKSSVLNLRVDGKVIYTRLVAVLDILQKNKLENISLITEKDNK